MERNDNKIRSIHSVANDYFKYLGKHLPQQCASDEFYFFPRSEAAVQNLDLLDDLTPEKIQDYIRHVRRLLREISSIEALDLEGETDRLLLKQSMESFVREFEYAKVWQNDPSLYVKIPLFAIGRILSQTDRNPDRIKSDLLTIFSQIPSFLGIAINNLHSPSEISLKIGLDMAHDATHFHNRDIPAFILEKTGGDRGLFSKNREVSGSWEGFTRDLMDLPSRVHLP